MIKCLSALKNGGIMLAAAVMTPQWLILLDFNFTVFLTCTLVEVKRDHQLIKDHEKQKSMLLFLNLNASEVSTQHLVSIT